MFFSGLPVRLQPWTWVTIQVLYPPHLQDPHTLTTSLLPSLPFSSAQLAPPAGLKSLADVRLLFLLGADSAPISRSSLHPDCVVVYIGSHGDNGEAPMPMSSVNQYFSFGFR